MPYWRVHFLEMFPAIIAIAINIVGLAAAATLFVASSINMEREARSRERRRERVSEFS